MFAAMIEDTFRLRADDEFIELIKVLKIKQLVQSGGHAKLVIEEGLIYVNGEQEFRKRKKLRPGDIVQFEDNKIEILEAES